MNAFYKNRKIIARLITICFLAIAISSCPSPEQGRYQNREGKFSIVFPKGWEVRERQLGLDAIGFEPLSSGLDKFRENVAVASSAMTKPMDGEGLLDANLPAMIQMITDFKPEDRGHLEIQGRDAAYLRYSQRQGEFKLTSLLYAVPGKTRAYLVYCTGESENFPKFQPECEKVVKTFKALE
jgi:hypothetical protein